MLCTPWTTDSPPAVHRWYFCTFLLFLAVRAKLAVIPHGFDQSVQFGQSGQIGHYGPL